MIGKTLGVYFARHFFRNVVITFLIFFFLIAAVDLIDQSRKFSKLPDVGFMEFVKISVARTPLFAENVLGFATLFGSIATLIILNQRMELVVARAAGVSVWQFLLPAAATAIVLGLISSMAYNPLALVSQNYALDLEAKIYGEAAGNFSGQTKNFWLRTSSREGSSILRAKVARDSGKRLSGVTLYSYRPDGEIGTRIDAKTARFATGKDGSPVWQFRVATISEPGEKQRAVNRIDIPANTTESQLQNTSVDANRTGFWQLPAEEANAAASGRSSLPFQTRYQSLLARPLFFVAMVLFAACVSLRFARFGQNGKLILGGVLAGFMLYVVSELVMTFGRNGIVPPFVAAWVPVFVATLMGLTILLHQEDG